MSEMSWGVPCSRQTLAKWATIGGGPLFRKAGRFPLYEVSDLDAWVLNSVSGPSSDQHLIGQHEIGSKPPSYPTGSAKRKLKVAINPRLINKNETGDKALFTHGWQNAELTPDELAAKVQQGISYCAQLQRAAQGRELFGGRCHLGRHRPW